MTCSTRSVVAVALLVAAAGCDRTPCDVREMAWIEDGLVFDGDLTSVSLMPGSTLHICPGTLSQSTAVSGKGGQITIEGAGIDGTMFEGAGLDVWNTNSDVVIRGLTVRGAALAPDDEDDADAGTGGRWLGAGLYLNGLTARLEDVRLAEDGDGGGGALSMGPDIVTTIVDSEIKSNEGGGAVLAYSGSTLVSQDTYWGSGDDDNDGHDVSILKSNGDLIEGYDFNGVASFTCWWDDQVCE